MYRSRLLALGIAALVASCGSPEDGPGIAPEGRWSGDLESGYLPSGSSRVVIEVERAVAGEPVVARIVFGEGAAPSPGPTDPEVGWPPTVDPQLDSIPVADGFVYRSTGGMRVEDQVRFDVAATELWAPWCELQTPYRIAAGSDQSQCLPNRPWTATPFECQLDADEGLEAEPVDCLKLALCRRTRVCDCTTAGCVASPTGLTMFVDLLFTADTAVGSIVWRSETGTEGANGTARVSLTRD